MPFFFTPRFKKFNSTSFYGVSAVTPIHVSPKNTGLLAVNEQTGKTLKSRQIEMVYENALAGSVFSVLVALVLAVASFLIESGLHGFFWLLGILCVFVTFGGLSDRYFKDPQRHERVEYWSRWIIALSLVCGLTWGLAAWLLFVDQSVVLKFFVYTVLASVAAVSVSIFAARFTVFLSFVLPLLTVTALETIHAGDFLLVFGGFILLLGAVLVRVGWRYYRDVKSLCLFATENLSLREELEATIDTKQKASTKEARSRALLEDAGVMVWRIDKDNQIKSISKRFADLTGFQLADLNGTPLLSFIERKADVTTARTDIELAIGRRKAFREVECKVTGINDSQFVFNAYGKTLTDEEGQFAGFEGYFRDVTASRLAISQLTYKAQHDPITGLINRMQFLELVDVYVPPLNLRGMIPHIIYIDIRNLKIVNDTLGLAAGDEMFSDLAALLEDMLGEKGVVARLGGGAFGVLLEPGELTGALKVATQLLTGLNQYRLHRQELTFSIQARAGLAGISPQMNSADEALACADLACRSSDPNESNPLGVYRPEMSTVSRSSTSELLAELVSDLENNKLCLQYQPIVDLQTDRTVWLEVLLASQGENDVPELVGNRLVAAEKYGMIGKFDRWVVETALRSIVTHPSLSIDGIFVNISPLTLQDHQFANFVQERLNYHKVEPAKLCIDVTASTDVSDHNIASENLTSLGQLGCQIALDDFGTGTSSLQNLKRLPANFLKINHVFLEGLADDEMDQNICQAIVDLAARGGCSVIAESVQDASMIDILKQFNIELAQGYALGAPMSLEVFMGQHSDNVISLPNHPLRRTG